MPEINIGIAFLAGLISFVSPCCLPLYPSYLSYITGVSVSRLKEETTREVRFLTVSHTLFFIIGFSIVFYTLGFGAGAIGDYFTQYQRLISQLSGILVIVMGLFLLGIFQPQFLMKERKLQFKWKPAGYLGTLLIGIGFAAGWSPCIGPILQVIISMALTDPSSWFKLITAYTLGFAVPFVVFSFFLGSVKSLLKYSNRVMKIGGAFMILMGVLLYTEKMTQITIWLNAITPEWMKY